MKKYDAVAKAKEAVAREGGVWYVTRLRTSYNFIHSDRYRGRWSNGRIAQIVTKAGGNK